MHKHAFRNKLTLPPHTAVHIEAKRVIAPIPYKAYGYSQSRAPSCRSAIKDSAEGSKREAFKGFGPHIPNAGGLLSLLQHMRHVFLSWRCSIKVSNILICPCIMVKAIHCHAIAATAPPVSNSGVPTLPQLPDLNNMDVRSRWNAVHLAYVGDAVWEVGESSLWQDSACGSGMVQFEIVHCKGLAVNA